MEEQFPCEVYKVSRTDAFKFKDGTEPLKIIAPAEHDQCVIAKEPTNAEVQ